MGWKMGIYNPLSVMLAEDIKLESRVIGIDREKKRLYISLPEHSTISLGDLLGAKIKDEPWMYEGDVSTVSAPVIVLRLRDKRVYKVAGFESWSMDASERRRDVPVYPGEVTIDGRVYTYRYLRQLMMAPQNEPESIQAEPKSASLPKPVNSNEQRLAVKEALVSVGSKNPESPTIPSIQLPSDQVFRQLEVDGRMVMSDGELAIPLVYPRGREAKKLSKERALGVNIEQIAVRSEWPHFVQRLAGWRLADIKGDYRKVFTEDPPQHSQSGAEVPSSEYSARDQGQDLIADQGQLANLINDVQQILDGLKYNQSEVVTGSAKGRASVAVNYAGVPIHFSLSETGGLYIFDHQQIAEEFISGKLSIKEAGQLAIGGHGFRHNRDWQLRVRRVVLAFVQKIERAEVENKK
jgi:hypothetical protein